MKYLFSDTGLKVVESLSFTKTLYAFDFDGTLAPIVSTPDLARASAETMRLLRELAKVATVVVISGRAVADLRTRIKLPGDHLIGNHGLEGFGAHKESISQAASMCSNWTKQLTCAWGPLRPDRGIFIEDKTYSLALHYRQSRNKRQARMKLFSLLEKLDPAPRVILGKCVMNLVPAGGPHKGVALLEAMIQLGVKCAFYVGDDDTDEDVFALPDSRIISVRVGQKKTSQALFYLKRQSEMNRLIRKLVRMQQK